MKPMAKSKQTSVFTIILLIVAGIIGILFYLTTKGVEKDLSLGQAPASSDNQVVEVIEVVQPIDPSIVHKLDYEATLEENNLAITGTTNIPDNSVLNVSVNRYVEYETLDGKRVEDLADADVSVTDGKFSYTTILDDHNWYTEDFFRENEIFETPLKFIFDEVYIIVTFTPANDQPQEIYDLLGRHFENLNPESSGVGVVKNTLQVTKEIKAPITADVLKDFQDKIDKEEVEQKVWEQSKAGKICKENPGWSKEDCQLVAEKKYWIGMHLDMLKYNRGLPSSASPSNYGSGNEWQWCWWDYKPSCFYGGDDGIIESYN